MCCVGATSGDDAAAAVHAAKKSVNHSFTVLVHHLMLYTDIVQAVDDCVGGCKCNFSIDSDWKTSYKGTFLNRLLQWSDMMMPCVV